MRKASGPTLTGPISRNVLPMRTRAPEVRPFRFWRWALAVPLGLIAAEQIGLIVVAVLWLPGSPTDASFGASEPLPGSGGARSHASGDPAATSNVATALNGPARAPEPPPSRPEASPAPRPPRDDVLRPAVGPAEAPRSVADAADNRPGAAVLAEARPGSVLPTAGDAEPSELDARSLGRELFAREWQPNDPRCHGGDGLGPVYNATSCLACHNLGGPGGAGPARENVLIATGTGFVYAPKKPVVVDGVTYSSMLTRVGAFDEGHLMALAPERADLVKIHPGFRKARSTVIHRFGVDPDYSRWRETFRWTPHDWNAAPVVRGWEAQLDRLGGPAVVIRISPHDSDLPPVVAGTWLADGRPIPSEARESLQTALGSPVVVDRVALSLTKRNAPPLFGAGLIDALPEAALEITASQQPVPIRGRVHRMKNGQIGRFGWKAQVATLEDFILTACANELGLEAPAHHQAASPLNPDAEARALDMTQAECNALVSYVRSLPAPGSITDVSPAVEDGRRLFQSIGCAGCHTPNLGSIGGIYSDLLLHDMGQQLKDAGAYYEERNESDSSSAARLTEWRTPPLWGFPDSGPYLHDGRAQTLDEAVALHGGQGAASSYYFRKLTWQQRSQVRAFLETLGPNGASRVVQPAETEVPAVRPPVAAPTTRYTANRPRTRRQAALAAERRRQSAIGLGREPVRVAPAPRRRPDAAERINVPRRSSDQRVVEKPADPFDLLRRGSILDGDTARDAREQQPGPAVPATGQP